jgi:hypothetical protein
MIELIRTFRKQRKPLDVQLIALKQAGFKVTISEVVNINNELDKLKDA